MQTPPPDFTTALRGYDRRQVEALIEQANQALASADENLRVSAREALQEPTLMVRVRGYDRQQVEDYLTDLVKRLT